MAADCETTRISLKWLLSRPRPRHFVTLGLVALLLLATILWRDVRPSEAVAASSPRAERRSAATAQAEPSNPVSHVGPTKHVYFLKTHKCASTTVQRIVLTYAIRNNLSVALPTSSINSFYPRPFSPARAKRTCTYPRFDVMASHAVFSESSRRSMPADTVYAAIVRDPADQMESAYYYYLVGFCRTFPYKTLSFSRYLSTAIRQYGGNGDAVASSWSSSLRYGCNMRELRFLQLHDFGFYPSEPPTPRQVQAAIKRLDTLFDIVLIVERLDEGLVLLRDLLGWSTADILHLRSNFRVNSTSPKAAAAAKATPLPMSNATRRAAYEWNWGDKMLYDHFRAKMDAAIAQNAEYVREQVSEFRRQQEAFQHRCVTAVTVGDPVRSGSSVRTGSYVLSRNASLECRLAAMDELDLFRLMNEQQPKCRERRVARKT